MYLYALEFLARKGLLRAMEALCLAMIAVNQDNGITAKSVEFPAPQLDGKKALFSSARALARRAFFALCRLDMSLGQAAY